MKQITTLLNPLEREPYIPWWFFWLLGATGLITLIVVIQMRRKPEIAVGGPGEAGALTESLSSQTGAGEDAASTGQPATEISRPADLLEYTAVPVRSEEVAPSEPDPAGEKPQADSPDDLTAIGGVGPKISKLLQDAGITTFSQLASTSVEQLRQILKDANLRIADPETWPEQASLAAAGKWDELSQLQAALKGGRRKD